MKAGPARNSIAGRSSRHLNEKTNWFGLEVLDLAALGYFLVLSFEFLGRWNLELFAFLAAALIAIGLMHVRLTQRPKCIRDYLQFKIKRTLQWI